MSSSNALRVVSGLRAAVACVLISGGASALAQDRPIWPKAHPPPPNAKDSGLGAGSDLDTFILAKMEEARLPSMSACVIHNDRVIWSSAYGLANIEQEIPATVDTLHFVASNSKPVAVMALMRLYEQGKFELDHGVNDYLDFEVHHPDYPDTPITIRMLLSMAAAIDDNWPILRDLVVQGDSPIPVGEFLPDYLVPGGAYYDEAANFILSREPGEAYHYSNVGFSLGAYVLEPLAQQTLPEYCDEHLFGPLEMSETSWYLAGLDVDHVAMPYTYNEGLDTYVPLGHQGWPALPAAGLRTSVMQQARILMAQMNDGESRGVPVLKPLTIALMQVPQEPAPTYGLGLYRFGGCNEPVWIGHDGCWWGNRTYMYYRPADNVGIIMFTNGDPCQENRELPFAQIFYRLAAEFEQTCPADVNDDGSVDFSDLLDLLARWGPCEGCPEDTDHDGFVGFTDLLSVLGDWGPCRHIAATGPLGPVGHGVRPAQTLGGLPSAAGDVTLSFKAIADLGDPTEALNVYLNGSLVATVFGDGANDCPEQPDTAQVILSAETFNDIVPPGCATLEVEGTAGVDAHQCDGFSYVEVNVAYVGLPMLADNCGDAPVVGDGAYRYSTLEASDDGPSLPPECDEGNGRTFRRDVWIRYAASCTGVATASVCNSDFNTKLAVYGVSGCPGDIIACSDDACGEGGTRSETTFPVVQGEEYLVRIGGRTSTGTGTLVLRCEEGFD